VPHRKVRQKSERELIRRVMVGIIPPISKEEKKRKREGASPSALTNNKNLECLKGAGYPRVEYCISENSQRMSSYGEKGIPETKEADVLRTTCKPARKRRGKFQKAAGFRSQSAPERGRRSASSDAVTRGKEGGG